MADTDIIVRIIQEIVADANGAEVAGKTVREKLLAEQKKLTSGLEATGQTGSASELEAELARLEQISKRAQAAITAANTGSDAPGAVRSRVATALIPPGPEGVTPEIAAARKDLAKDLKSLPIDDLIGRLNVLAGAINDTSAKIAAARDPVTQARTSVQQTRDQAAALEQELEEGGPEAHAQKRAAAAAKEAATLEALASAELGLAEGYVKNLATIKLLTARFEADTLKILASSNEYATALASAAKSEAKIEAKKLRILAESDKYAKNLASAAKSQARINAKKDEELASSSKYAKSLARSAIAQARITANTQQILSRSDEYAKQLARGTLFQARTNANVQERLAAGGKYATELARSAVAQAKINADKLKELATHPTYVSELARAATFQAVINASKNKELASNQTYISALASSASAQARINAQKQSLLAADGSYIASQAQTASAQASINAQKQAILAGDSRYISNLAQTTASQASINAQKQALLAQDSVYVNTLTQTTATQAGINAQKQAILAQDTLYIGTLAKTTATQASIDAQKQAILAQDSAYITTLARTTVTQASIDAQKQALLAQDSNYVRLLANTVASQETINANKQAILAQDSLYVSTLARVTSTQSQIEARKQAILALDSNYINTQAQITASQAKINSSKQALLAADSNYIRTLVQTTTTQASINSQKQAILSLDSNYVRILAQTTATEESINAQKQALLAGNAKYIQSLTNAAISQESITGQKTALLATDAFYAKSLAQTAALQAQINRKKTEELAVNSSLSSEQAKTTAAQAQINVAKLRELQTIPGYVQNLAEADIVQEQINVLKKIELQRLGQARVQLAGEALDRDLITEKNRVFSEDSIEGARARSSFSGGKLSDAKRAAAEAKLIASDDELIKAQAEETANSKLAAAKKQQMLLVEDEFIAAQKIEAANTLKSAAAKAKNAAEAAATPEGRKNRLIAVENQGVLAAQSRVEKELQRVVELQQLLNLDKTQKQALISQTENAIERGALLEQLNVLTKERIALERRAAVAQAGAGIDRRHQAFRPDAALSESGGIGFAQGFRSTLRFGVASAAIYGLARGISEAVREATELDRLFNQIERQFKSQFDGSEASAQFALFKEQVFEIAELTGQAADEVANVGFQLQGAFGGDTLKAINETGDAIIAARVTGLEVGEVIDSFTALTQSFEDSDLRIERISDSALQLQEDLGVLAKETITFAADLAPLGAELGFTAEKLSAIGAVAQQTSGRSGTALAEAFGRVLPQIQSKAVEVIQIFKTLGPDVADQVRNAFKNNDIDAVFDQLLQNFNRFDQGARNALIEVLGGRREAQSIIGVLSNGPKVFEEYQRALDSSGKTTEYFNDLQDTLQQRLAVLGEEFKRLVQTLFESGLKDFFVDFINLLETTVKLFEVLIGVASTLGGVLGPLSGPLALLAQGALITRGAGALRGGFNKLRPTTGGLALPTSSITAGPASAFRAQQASRIAQDSRFALTGAAFTKGFGGRFNAGVLGAIPSVGGLAAAAGAIYFSSVDSKVSEEAEKAAKELGSKFESFDLDTEEGLTGLDQQINAISKDLGLGFGASRQRIEQALREGKSVEDLTNSLGEIATRNASFYQQFLDGLPGDLSRDIEVAQAKASEAVKFVYESIIREGFIAGLSNLDDAGAQELKTEITEALTEALALTDTGFGEFTPADIGASATLREQQALGEAPDTNPLTQAYEGLTKEGKKQAEEVLELFKGDKTTEEIIAIASEIQRRSKEEDEFPDIQDFIAPAMSKIIDDGNAILATQKAVGEAIKTLEQAQAEFEAGSLSASGLQQEQASALTELKNLDDLTGYYKLLAETRELAFDRLSNELDSLEGLAELSGVDQTGLISTRISEILADPKSNLSIEQEGDFALRLVDAIRQQRAAEAQFIEDEVERARFLAADITNLVSGDVRQALLAQMISAQTEFIDALSALTDDEQGSIDGIVREIARVAVETGVSLEEAANQVIFARERAQVLIRQTQDYLRLLERRAAAVMAAGDDGLAIIVANFEYAKKLGEQQGKQAEELAALDAEAQKKADEAAALIANSPTNISGPGGPGDVAKAEADAAKAAADAAKKAADEARRAAEERERYLAELRQAKDDYTLALVESNPVKAAEVALFTSTAAIGRAKTEAERYSALAERVRADRALKETIFDIQASQLELLIAITDAAGETIESAELQIEAIKQRLYFAKTQNLGDAAYNRLKAELVGAEAALRDATLAERRESFQFLFDMGKITQGQLINYLQSLLAIPELTEKQIRDIQKEIHGLRQQLGQDFQFNLPSNLSLPTLYEARRFDPGMSGGGYNDNRVITVTVNAETDASPEAIATAVATAVGDPTRSGTAVRKY